MATLALASSGRRRTMRRTPDPFILAVVFGLLLTGLLITYSASYSLADADLGDGAYFVRRQLLWTLIGVVALAVTMSVDYRVWQRYSILLMIGTVLMLTALLAVGAERFGGQRWVLGGGSVQPSEIAKLAVIVYVADWLAGKREDIRDVTLGLIPFSILIGVISGLVLLQPDFSTALLIGVVASIMFFTAGADLKQMAGSAALAGVVLSGVVLRAPYRLQRIRIWLHPDADTVGVGYQPWQTLQTLMRGGLTGVGLGQGQQKLVLPAPHTDAAFAVLGEELGVLGCLAVVLMFAVLAWRGLRIASGSPDRFAGLLASGITCWLTVQALLNVAVVTSLVPFTGIPLPFISFGGSSLVMCMAATGVLLNLSRHVDSRRTKLYAHLDLRRRNRRARLSRTHRARSLRQ